MKQEDPCRAAILLVETHGHDARTKVIRQIAAMKASGDIPAEIAWKRIFGAIVALEATECARKQAANLIPGRRAQALRYGRPIRPAEPVMQADRPAASGF